MIEKKWLTTAEVVKLLGFGLSKTKLLVAQGDVRSVKHGHHRRILPKWVDEFVERVARDQEAA